MDNLQVDDRLTIRNSRIVQAFPGFRMKTFTFFITLTQIVVYFCSVFLGNYEIINPSEESLIRLGAMVRKR
jgi:hypothetical protein